MKEQIEEMTCEKCLHHFACLTNSEYVPTLCPAYEDKAGYRKQEWISVDERLPENHRRVLIACEGTTIGGAAAIAIGSYGGGFWSIADADGTAYLTKYMHVVVTHWMPLPEPPNMKGGAE